MADMAGAVHESEMEAGIPFQRVEPQGPQQLALLVSTSIDDIQAVDSVAHLATWENCKV